MQSRSILVLTALAAVSLGGCSQLRAIAGVDKKPPDEFTVLARAPLDMPPDYTLRPPQAGAPRPQDASPMQQAKQTVFRVEDKDKNTVAASLTAGRSPGEAAFLQEAGASRANPNIRQLVAQENSRLFPTDRGFIDKLIFWKKPEPKGEVIDATKEAQRLRENAALGKPTTVGETPTIERKKKSLLETLF